MHRIILFTLIALAHSAPAIVDLPESATQIDIQNAVVEKDVYFLVRVPGFASAEMDDTGDFIDMVKTVQKEEYGKIKVTMMDGDDEIIQLKEHQPYKKLNSPVPARKRREEKTIIPGPVERLKREPFDYEYETIEPLSDERIKEIREELKKERMGTSTTVIPGTSEAPSTFNETEATSPSEQNAAKITPGPMEREKRKPFDYDYETVATIVIKQTSDGPVYEGLPLSPERTKEIREELKRERMGTSTTVIPVTSEAPSTNETDATSPPEQNAEITTVIPETELTIPSEQNVTVSPGNNETEATSPPEKNAEVITAIPEAEVTSPPEHNVTLSPGNNETEATSSPEKNAEVITAIPEAEVTSPPEKNAEVITAIPEAEVTSPPEHNVTLSPGNNETEATSPPEKNAEVITAIPEAEVTSPPEQNVTLSPGNNDTVTSPPDQNAEVSFKIAEAAVSPEQDATVDSKPETIDTEATL